MSNQDIKRGITSRHGRGPGENPELGKLIRMRGEDSLEIGNRGRRRRRNPGMASQLPLGWMILFGAGSLVTILAVFGIWILPRMAGDDAIPVSSREVIVKDRIKSRFPSPSEMDALGLVKRALATRDPERVEGLFHKGNFSADEVVAFLKSFPVTEGNILRYRWLSSMDVENLLLEGVMVTTGDATAQRERLAFLTPDNQGCWKVDFESFATVCNPSWDKLLLDPYARGVARVKIERVPYYNGIFSDDRVWTAYKLTCPGQEVSLWAYSESDSELAASIEDLFYENQKACRVTLEIARVPGAETRQVKILGLLSGEWVVPSVAMSEQ